MHHLIKDFNNDMPTSLRELLTWLDVVMGFLFIKSGTMHLSPVVLQAFWCFSAFLIYVSTSNYYYLVMSKVSATSLIGLFSFCLFF